MSLIWLVFLAVTAVFFTEPPVRYGMALQGAFGHLFLKADVQLYAWHIGVTASGSCFLQKSCGCAKTSKTFASDHYQFQYL